MTRYYSASSCKVYEQVVAGALITTIGLPWVADVVVHMRGGHAPTHYELHVTPYTVTVSSSTSGGPASGFGVQIALIPNDTLEAQLAGVIPSDLPPVSVTDRAVAPAPRPMHMPPAQVQAAPAHPVYQTVLARPFLPRRSC